MPAMSGKTLYDKIWDAHVVAEDPNGETMLYVDLHLIHEVTSPQAFAGLRTAHRPVRRPDLTLAVADHNVPTEGQALGVDAVADDEARLQLQTLGRNVAEARSGEVCSCLGQCGRRIGQVRAGHREDGVPQP